MPKTESTAVNELIGLVQSNKPMAPEPSENLFAAPKPAGSRVNPPRMTQSVPPMRGAGEVAPLPRTRAPSSTSSHKLPALPPPVRITTAPPTRVSTIPPLTKPALPPPRAGSKPTLPPLPSRTAQPKSSPVAAPFEANPFVAVPQYPVVSRTPTIDQTSDAIRADDWFEQSRAVEKIDEEWMGTQPILKRKTSGEIAKKLIAPAAALLVLGVVVGGYYAFDGESATHHARPTQVATATPAAAKPKAAPAPAPAPVEQAAQPSAESPNAATATAGAEQPQPPPKSLAAAAPAPAPAAAPVAPVTPAPAAIAEEAPAVREVQTTRGVVKLIDVRIDSKPSGATVMLVDNGKTSFLGTTPVATSVNPSRAYDVIFTLEGKPTQMAHLDPAKTHHLDIALGGKPTAQAKAAPTPPSAPSPAPVAETPAAHHHHVAAVAAKPAAPIAEPSFDAPKAKPAAKGGTGTLMVSSKPPCEIVVDGKPTGLVTPQRSLPLAAGPHKITFINAQNNIKQTFPVAITADQSTKLIENLMK